MHTPVVFARRLTRFALVRPAPQVFSEFLAQCGRGLTPNPDLACNRHIKFDALLAFADKLGAELGEGMMGGSVCVICLSHGCVPCLLARLRC